MKIVNDGIHHAHNQAMYLSLFVAFIGILVSVLFYYLKKVDVEKVSGILNKVGLYNLSKNKFYIDKLYNSVLYKPFFKQTTNLNNLIVDYQDITQPTPIALEELNYGIIDTISGELVPTNIVIQIWNGIPNAPQAM